MRIAFYYECGQIKEIGTGHYYRCKILAEELNRRGHQVVSVDEECDVAVVDHMFSQAKLIEQLKRQGTKVVLIDGAQEDAPLVDASISACINAAAKFSGLEYLVISPPGKHRYDSFSSDQVFVSMGGFDYNEYSSHAVQLIKELGLKALVTKNINHFGIGEARGFEGSDFYLAMKECKIAITNGGLTMFQCLCFGIPTIAVAQYEHQKQNISLVSSICFSADIDGVKEQIQALESKDLRAISLASRKVIDGKGYSRVCDIIEGT